MRILRRRPRPAPAPDRDQGVASRLRADPSAFFAQLRAGGPVDTEHGLDGRVQVLSLDAGRRILLDPETFSSVATGGDRQAEQQIPLHVDPPEHGRYRRLLDPAFSPRSVASLEHDVVRCANLLIDGFVADGSCEFVEQFGAALPAAVFLRLFSVPFEDLDDFRALYRDLVRPKWDASGARDAIQARAAERASEMFRSIIAARRQDPRDDVISGLLRTQVDGRTLTTAEALNVCNLLMFAGIDTVTIALEYMIYRLATNPSLRAEITEHPDMIPRAVEELLRWETPVEGVSRVATRDVEVGGRPFRRGTIFRVMLAAIHVDPASAPGWDRIDFHRSANRHFAFGCGAHRCLGSHLARLQLCHAITEWHRRIPDYEVLPRHEVVWDGAPLYGTKHLPLVWHQRRHDSAGQRTRAL